MSSALHRARRAQVGVQPELLAERHVDAAEPLADRRRDRALERDLVAPDRLEDVRREGRPVLGHDRLAGVDDLPIEGDAGRVQDAAGCLRQLRTDAVAGDEGHTVGHGPIVAAAGMARPGSPRGRARPVGRHGARRWVSSAAEARRTRSRRTEIDPGEPSIGRSRVAPRSSVPVADHERRPVGRETPRRH